MSRLSDPHHIWRNYDLPVKILQWALITALLSVFFLVQLFPSLLLSRIVFQTLLPWWTFYTDLFVYGKYYLIKNQNTAQIQGGHCSWSKIQGGQLTTLPPPCRAPAWSLWLWWSVNLPSYQLLPIHHTNVRFRKLNKIIIQRSPLFLCVLNHNGRRYVLCLISAFSVSVTIKFHRYIMSAIYYQHIHKKCNMFAQVWNMQSAFYFYIVNFAIRLLQYMEMGW